MKSNDFKKNIEFTLSNLDNTVNDLQKGYDETVRVKNVLKNTREILDDLDEQFCHKTGLTMVDVDFLFIAIGLQIVRQYLITKFPQRLDDQTAANNTFGHREEHSNRKHRYYNPSLEEIITNPVPFDANIGANGALSGGGKMGHRVTAIGHDPLLGLIFGTANIATATLTIAMVHGLFFDGASVMDRKLYEIRTRKVISYSNIVASSTNLAEIKVVTKC